MTVELNIPEGGHMAVLRGEHNREMIEVWSEITVEVDARVMRAYAEDPGRSLSDVMPTLAYAHIAKAAFSLCIAADICAADFDAAEFGKRCLVYAGTKDRELMKRSGGSQRQ